jgi:transposase
LLDADHPVRAVWDYVVSVDLHELYDAIKAREHHPGRPAAEPRLLLALWLYATGAGVGSARRLDQFCNPRHGSLPYLWLCGGVALNYHTLADFRVAHADVLDRLLTDGIAVMLHEGLLEVDETAQDSLRVRAWAGGSSFHRRATLERCYAQTCQRVARLRQQACAAEQASPRQRAARLRAAQQRQRRLAEALVELQEVEQHKQQRQQERGAEKDRGGPDEARASSTDPQARKMKMPDGGYRPAYNVAFNTTTSGGVIVGLEVSNHGSDGGCVVPMLEQTERRSGRVPARHLVDSGFGTLDDIKEAKERFPATEVYAPVKQAKEKAAAGQDPYQPLPKDKPAVAAWRVRMGTAAAKGVYKRRAQTAEWANACARNRGLYGVKVRGLAKVKAVALWYVLAHNLSRLLALRAAQAARAGAAAGGAAA